MLVNLSYSVQKKYTALVRIGYYNHNLLEDLRRLPNLYRQFLQNFQTTRH